MVEMSVVRARFLLLVVAPAAFVMVALACLPDLAVSQPPGDSCGSGFVDLENGEACDPGDGSIGCSATCQILCEGDAGAIDQQTNHCYFWTTPASTNDQAAQACSLLGGHVVSFVDLNELNFVVAKSKTLPGAPDSGGTWLALDKGALNDAGFQTYFSYNGLELPGWSASCPGCYANEDGGDADFPLSGTNPQPCVYWRRSTAVSWLQNVCNLGTNAVPILCEREPPGTFSKPCTNDGATKDTCIEVPRTSAAKRYELLTDPRAYDVAKAECVARGGLLVRFETSAEREEVMGEAVRDLDIIDNVWIGLAFDGAAGAWRWEDGTLAPLAFPTPWGDSEPSVNAGAAAIHIDRGRYDTRLAHAQADTSQVFKAICQFAK